MRARITSAAVCILAPTCVYAAAGHGVPDEGTIAEVVRFVKEHQGWALPIIFALAFGESIAFISLVLPFWGILVALGAFLADAGVPMVPIWVASSIGAALGDWLSYSLGYHYHEHVAKMWPFSRHPDLLPKGHRFFERWGFLAIWVGRFSGPLRATVPVVAGATEMSWWKFQIANWGSAFLWAAVLLGLGNGAVGIFGYLRQLLA